MKPVLPGAAIGVLGGGQLGRMFAMAARRMGYRVHTLSPDTETPAGQVSDVEITADYADLDAVRDFAHGVSVVTFEFENIHASTVEAIEQVVPVRPAGAVLHIAQQRLREKEFLQQAGLPVPRFRPVRTAAELAEAIEFVGCPAVLKTARFGYDGKGQAVIRNAQNAADAWAAFGQEESILEAFVDFECELSVVAARGQDGEFAHYGAVENRHARHILDVTVAPGRIPERLQREAVEIARTVMEKLEVVGVLCVELFLSRDGHLLVNELAPRPHNSGHFTCDASVTSQFEQQLRAVCGLKLGSTLQAMPAACANLMGDLWNGDEPDWAAACAHPGVKLHLYGKKEARLGRKMGHLTAIAPTADEALARVLNCRLSLTRN